MPFSQTWIPYVVWCTTPSYLCTSAWYSTIFLEGFHSWVLLESYGFWYDFLILMCFKNLVFALLINLVPLLVPRMSTIHGKFPNTHAVTRSPLFLQDLIYPIFVQLTTWSLKRLKFHHCGLFIRLLTVEMSYNVSYPWANYWPPILYKCL